MYGLWLSPGARHPLQSRRLRGTGTGTERTESDRLDEKGRHVCESNENFACESGKQSFTFTFICPLGKTIGVLGCRNENFAYALAENT